ncbi:hypothetical protein [uncultured Helicobacter sp.]|nr:hypothetical protein [uncultured Helicobacter sp.]
MKIVIISCALSMRLSPAIWCKYALLIPIRENPPLYVSIAQGV